ncbi:MAG: aminoglycoside phosphotransferase family protein [Alicyclobacillus herbarius]|uniref:aminoglycoside phosphotransferase family protein n=1 Tax=Alicyclobacillus herbarius TaxID=122960 RepID=UPI0023574742|nr:aminoglycoside phosphotransferase family protein [Alicyclobacillus herbarius]MCL6633028.1 aminoglycoside phosphotransferase family protein [Alicyclobacillus herbarius]
MNQLTGKLDWQSIATALGLGRARVRPVAETAQATVVRLVPESGLSQDPRQAVIVKASRNHAAVAREAMLYERLVQHLPVSAPKVLSAGNVSAYAWIAYHDDGLLPITRRRHGILRAVQAAARLHQTPLPAQAEGVELVSHTPRWDEVLQETCRIDPDVFTAAMARSGWSGTARRAVRCMHRELAVWGESWAAHPRVLCHGDLHLGNLMWSRQTRQPILIDWEYAHLDCDYFDLFQLLDATSPTTPLRRPVSRWRVLQAYVEARPDLPPRAAAWVRGYLQFAALHLLWIARLIQQDWADGRFPEHELRRQERETYAGLVSLARDMRRLERS